MADTFRIKRRLTGLAGSPGTLANAEIAYNEVDHTLYYGEGTGGSGGSATSVVPIGGRGAFLPLTGGQLSNGLSFGQRIPFPTDPTNTTGHISLFDGWGGFSITSGTLNLISGAMLTMRFTGSQAILGAGVRLYLDADPVDVSEPVTLRYLNANTISTTAGDARWVNASGDTMTGQLNITNNSAFLNFKDAGGGDVKFIIGSDNHFGLYSTNAAGASAVTVWDFYARTDNPTQTFSLETYFNRFTHHNAGLSWAGGDFRQGSIYTDGNWGGLFRGYAGALADLAFADRDGTISLRIRQGWIEFTQAASFTNTSVTLTLSRDPGADMEAVTRQYVANNYAPITSGSYVAKGGDIMTGGLQINYTPTDTWSQLWLRPNSGNGGKGIIRFSGTFAAPQADGGARYAASIRSGQSINGWGGEHLDIFITNQVNDDSSDAKQSRAVRFTLGQTTIDTPVLITRNLAITPSTSGNDPVSLSVQNGYWARIFYTVTGTRTWGAGVRNDGVYVITDEGVAAIRFHIDLSGNAAFYQGLSVTNSLNVTGGINLVNAASTNPQDMSRGITFWGTPTSGYGLVVTDSTMNYNVFLSNNKHDFYAAGNLLFRIQGGDHVHSYIPFQAQTYIQINGASGADAKMVLNNGGGAGGVNDVWGYNAGSARWLMRLGGSNDESGGATGQGGSAFALFAYRNDGAFLGQPFYITRTPTGGDTTINGMGYVVVDPVYPLGIVNLRYLQANYTTATDGDARWVNVGGDTITGSLTINNNLTVQGVSDLWGWIRAGGNTTPADAAAVSGWGGVITNNITGGQGETDFVNLWYPYGGFRWYQKDTAGATTLRTLMQLQPNGNLALAGSGAYYSVATGGNAIGFGFASDGTANRVKLYVDGSDQGFLATTAFTDGTYLKLTGGTVTGETTISNSNFNVHNFSAGKYLTVLPGNMGSGAYNGLYQGGDHALLVSAGASDTGALTLMPWSNSALGIRIDGAAHTIRMDAVNGVGINAPTKIVKAGDGFPLIVSGNTRGVRFLVDGTQMAIEGVDNTGTASYQPLALGGSRINFSAAVYGLNAGDRATFQTGIYMNNNVAASATDLSHGIDMYGGGYGFSITGGTLNIVAGGATNFYPNGAFVSWINNAGMGFVTGKVLTLGRDPIDPMEAVTRQFFDYRQLYFNVKHYGAVDRVETGNATTDNATAVQNTDAINSTVTAVRNAGGGTVFFPAGTYLTSGTIALYPGVSVMGVGTASIIKPRTSMWTFAYLFEADTDVSASVSNLKIAPTAGMCVGVIGQFANLLKIHDVTFEGTNSYSIYLDRCGNYVIEDCFVTSSLSFPGGGVACLDSTGGNHGGGGTITRVRFVPMSGAPHGDSPFGHNSACIYLDGQATTNITECLLMWGAYGAGPITFILLQGNCQGNIIRDNLCLGVYFGILIQPGGSSGLMPSYISMIDNTIDSYGGIGIFIAASTTQSGRDMVIRGGAITQPGRLCTSVSLGNQGSGYWVGDLLTGPNPPFNEEGAAVIIQVTTIGGSGNVTGTSMYNQGLCQTFPTTVPVAYTGGHGSGATFYPNYADVGVGIWVRNTNRFNISDVYMETYSGHQLGYGFFLQNSTNGNMSRNQVYDHYDAIWMYDNNVYNIIFSQNILVGNAHVDFGGSVPQYSVVQDNIGVPWLSGTPALPATGAFAVNTMPYSQQVFITGGVMFGIAIRFGAPPGIGIQPAVGGQWNEPIILTLRPGNSIAVSYTTAPTWTWIPML